ncbi:conserved hypothetical protein [Mesorhizobium plurifarium]|uniref:Uncharacterized protein n=1 Tax=Mesorhizobium plurifarium TaxID=69974 RepID=A0A090EA28_MESPL|nr:conserved hypothetical protein [Mesorhizobium plurifarium]
MINQQKIARCAKATDIIIDKAGEASDALRIIFTNGYGILSDPSNVRGNLRTAKEAIDAALTTMKDTDWPTLADYGE